MARKSDRTKDSSLLSWLYERGEGSLAGLVEDLARSRSLTDGVAKAVRRAAEAKGQFDENMQTVLNLLNVPSRADYQKLAMKIQTLQGNLLNINMKLDRLLAQAEKPKRPPRRRPTPAAAKPAGEPDA